MTMKIARLPEDEAERLQTLRSLDLLDSPPDPVLDGLVRLAAGALGCPVALVSLVDHDRQWFKARTGLDAQETPRSLAFCAHAILDDALFVVPDTHADPRFAASPLVTGEPRVRFYAGRPLTVDGQRVGTLCVTDQVPRTLDAAQRASLDDLGRAVEHWLNARRAQVALQRREHELRMLAEQVPCVVYRTALDAQRSTLYISPQLRELGHRPEDWMARPDAWSRALHADDRLGVLRELHAAVRDGRPVELHYRLADGQGGWRHVRDTACQTTSGNDGTPVLQGVMQDVTAQVRADATQRRLTAIVEQATEAVVVTDLDGRIEYVNHAACETSGYSIGELIGRNARVFRSRHAPVEVPRALWAEIRAGRAWKGMFINRHKDGSDYVEYAIVRPVLDPAGQVTNYVALKQDVTEQRRLRAELLQYRARLDKLVLQRTAELDAARRAAEEASAAKSAFLAAMSHEIRTPMNGVIGIVDLLQQSSLAPYQRELADTIAESGQVLLALIDEILDFSKIEAGRIDLVSRPVALLALVEGTADTLQTMAARGGVDLHVFVDPQLPAQVLGDAVRLRQIVTNLAANAVKFSAGLPRPGRVSLRLLATDGGGQRLEVSDNGIGLDADTLGRLFQPFEQGQREAVRVRGGTGLGLVITQRLVQAMGGTISATNREQGGARFVVDLALPAVAGPAPLAWDLHGLRCALDLHSAGQGADTGRERDWGRWLAAAGAQIVGPATAGQTADADADAGRCVWVVAGDALATGAAQQDPCVRLGRGRRRRPRRDADGHITLDLPGVHRDALLEAVALAAGRCELSAPEVGIAPADGLLQEPDAGLAARQGRLVLVAEDNDINQRVIAHQLRRLGLAAEVVSDGAQALALWQAGPARYGLLLTDLQMPVLDGCALAAAIRRAEAPGQRLPILALTATAVADDGESHRAAGIDGHLVKPVTVAMLRTTLARWLPVPPRQPAPPPQPPATAPASSAADFDESALKRQVGNDEALWQLLCSTYVDDARRTMTAIDEAMRQNALDCVGALAHRLKSSSRAVGALALGHALDALEQATRAGDREPASVPVPVPVLVARVHAHLAPVLLRLDHAGAAEAVRIVNGSPL
jgi:PAS domain S-box-containing protein